MQLMASNDFTTIYKTKYTWNIRDYISIDIGKIQLNFNSFIWRLSQRVLHGKYMRKGERIYVNLRRWK